MDIQPKGFVWKWKEVPSLEVTRRATERMLHEVVAANEIKYHSALHEVQTHFGDNTTVSVQEIEVHGEAWLEPVLVFSWPGHLPGEFGVHNGVNMFGTLNPDFGDLVQRMLEIAKEECGDAMELSVQTGAQVAWQLAA